MLESAQIASPGVPILTEITVPGGTRFKKKPENAQPEEGKDQIPDFFAKKNSPSVNAALQL